MTNRLDSPNWVFNLYDDTSGIARELGDGLHARIFLGHNCMLSIVHIDPNTTGMIHRHAEEQWGILLKGECIRIQEGEEIPMKAGDFWHTPGTFSHGIRTGTQAAIVLDIFSPPRPEYRKPGTGFGNVQQE